MDSNFPYAGAVNLVVGPFGWVVLCDRVRVRARRFWDNAVLATRLGDVSRRRRGGPPHRSIDEGSVTGLAGAMAPDRRDRPQFGLLHAGDLAPVVFDGEIEIGLTRHHGRVGGDRTQCFIEVTAVKPGPQQSWPGIAFRPPFL